MTVEENYAGREIAGPSPSTEVPIGQDCKSTTESLTDSKASQARRQFPGSRANIEQSPEQARPWRNLQIEKAMECTFTCMHPEYARATMPCDHIFQSLI